VVTWAVVAKGRLRLAARLTAIGLALVLCACSASSSSSTATSPAKASQAKGGVSSNSPGVTASTITVGQVDDLSAPLPGLFKGAEDGTKAYFDFVNSQGGVDGRKITLDARDSAYQAGLVATQTAAQVGSDFALVGGFSLLDSAEKAPIDSGHMPDVAVPVDFGLSVDSYVYSPIPSPDNNYPVGLFKYLKQRYPTQTKHVGILYSTATPETVEDETAFERALKSQGLDVAYRAGYGPLQTTFLSYVLAMKNAGVRMFFTYQLTDSDAAAVAKEMRAENFNPINIEGSAYSNQLVELAGSAANGMFITQGLALYLGQDAKVVPAVGLFDHWVKVADPHATFDVETVYGWASAELFVQALRQAGSSPTRHRLLAALNHITSFGADGLITTSNPAANVLSPCFLMAQVQHGKFVRVPPSPSTGFYCGYGGYSRSPNFHREARPQAD
jgi:ABC-type branched-subunit amino acid transport system substrate-binding protein